MNVILCEFETPNFTFQAIGTDEGKLKRQMKTAWKKHCKQYPNASPDYYRFDDCRITKFVVDGPALRDGDKI